MRFDNRYCWVVYFQNGVIVRIRTHLDSAMVTRLFDEKPLASGDFPTLHRTKKEI
jgi:uncharacterized protein